MEINKPKKTNVFHLKKNKNKCPNCKNFSREPYIPFCSKKCSNEDLNKWLSDERYVNTNID